MTIARTFRDLIVYKQARAAAGKIFQISKTFPPEEKYSLTDQIRRSSRAAFVNKLDEALEETTETQAWLDYALDCCYISQEQFKSLDAEYQGIGGRLTRMMQTADDWCKLPPNAQNFIPSRESTPQTPKPTANTHLTSRTKAVTSPRQAPS
ncbi:MAG: four helix bundle protein [Verrucomicrobia bacterium]|nr:MAG: four helix bundle protein [Verrucomicrobiota bacterium]